MSDRGFSDSPQRRPVASGSDSLLYSGDRHGRRSEHAPVPKRQDQYQKAAGVALSYGSVWAFEIVSHPFIVLRRSCQTSLGSFHHLQPFTLIPVVYNLSSNKPPAWVYKGFVSSLLARGFNMFAENLIHEMSYWPLTVSSYSSVKKQCQHLMLKWTGYLVCTPFFISSFVETVQSYGANEPPALFEFFFDGCHRLVGHGYRAAWIVPMWKLLIPAATFRLLQYVIQQCTSHIILRIFREERVQKEMDQEVSIDRATQYEQVYPELLATFSGMLLADIVLLPFETVLHRLYLQGTRVLTDNMDHGREVLGVQFQYSGFLDCIWQIMCDDGLSGFYRGLGAVLLQYACQFIGLKLLEWALERLNGNGNKQYRRSDTAAKSYSKYMLCV